MCISNIFDVRKGHEICAGVDGTQTEEMFICWMLGVSCTSRGLDVLYIEFACHKFFKLT